jgi:hypothetical protein
MSNSTAADPTSANVDPRIGLLFTVADHLIPLFKTGSIEIPLARQMAVSAIEAYQPETRADYVNVARTIAFSMAALALLSNATSHDLTMTEKMRALGRANALNRAADQSERTMMQRRRFQQAHPLPPDPASAPPTHDSPIENQEIEAAIADAMQDYLATRPSAKTPAPPPTSASYHNGPAPISVQPRTASYRTGLLQQSAIQRVVNEASFPNPA